MEKESLAEFLAKEIHRNYQLGVKHDDLEGAMLLTKALLEEAFKFQD